MNKCAITFAFISLIIYAIYFLVFITEDLNDQAKYSSLVLGIWNCISICLMIATLGINKKKIMEKMFLVYIHIICTICMLGVFIFSVVSISKFTSITRKKKYHLFVQLGFCILNFVVWVLEMLASMRFMAIYITKYKSQMTSINDIYRPSYEGVYGDT